MNYDEMLKTTQKKTQTINTNSEEKAKLKLADSEQKQKLKPQVAPDAEFMTQQAKNQREFIKKYQSNRSGFEVIDETETDIEKSIFKPVNEKVEIRSFDKTFKNRIKKDAGKMVKKWDETCGINGLKDYGFKISKKDVNYKTYSMMVGLHNWAHVKSLKEQCAAGLKNNEFYRKNKDIIDGLAPTLQMNAKAQKEIDNASTNPFDLDLNFQKFTPESVQAVKDYYKQFDTENEDLQNSLLKNAFEDSLICMDNLNTKAFGPDAMPQRMFENKQLRDRLEAVHRYSVTFKAGNEGQEFEKHVQIARELFMALDADLRTCLTKNGVSFNENGKFILAKNRQGVQVRPGDDLLNTSFHNLSSKNKTVGHLAETIVSNINESVYYNIKPYTDEYKNHVESFYGDLFQKAEQYEADKVDELGIGEAVTNMQLSHAEKYNDNKAMLDPMIEDSKKVAASVDSLNHQIKYLEKLVSGSDIPEGSADIAMKVHRNENIRKSIQTQIEQKKRQVIDLLGRANGFINAMGNIYSGSELSPEGQDIIEKYRKEGYVDNSQTANLLRSLGEISDQDVDNDPDKFNSFLIKKLIAAKEKSLNKPLTGKQIDKLWNWLTSTSGGLCIADLKLKGFDFATKSDEEVYKEIGHYAPLLGSLNTRSSRNKLSLDRDLSEYKEVDEKELVKSVSDQILNLSSDFKTLFVNVFGNKTELEKAIEGAKGFRDKIASIMELRKKYDSIQKLLNYQIDVKDIKDANSVRMTLEEALEAKMPLETRDLFKSMQLMYQKEFQIVENFLFEFKLGELVKKVDMGITIDQLLKDEIFGKHPDLRNAVKLFQKNKYGIVKEGELENVVRTYYAMHKEHTTNAYNNLVKQYGLDSADNGAYKDSLKLFMDKLRDYSAGKYEEDEEAKQLKEVQQEITNEKIKKNLNEQEQKHKKIIDSMAVEHQEMNLLDDFIDSGNPELEKDVDWMLSFGQGENYFATDLRNILAKNDDLAKFDTKLLYVKNELLKPEEIAARDNYISAINNIAFAADALKIKQMSFEDDAPNEVRIRFEARKLCKITDAAKRAEATETLKNKLLNGELDNLNQGTRLRLLLMCDKNISGRLRNVFNEKTKKIEVKDHFTTQEIEGIVQKLFMLTNLPVHFFNDRADAKVEEERRLKEQEYKEKTAIPENLKDEVNRLLSLGQPSINKDFNYTIYNDIRFDNMSILKLALEKKVDKKILFVDDKYLTDKEIEAKKEYLNNLYIMCRSYDEIYGSKGNLSNNNGLDYDASILIDMAKKLANPENDEDQLENYKKELEKLMEPSEKINNDTRFKLKILYYNKFGIDMKDLANENWSGISKKKANSEITALMKKAFELTGVNYIDNNERLIGKYYQNARMDQSIKATGKQENDSAHPDNIQTKVHIDVFSKLLLLEDMHLSNQLVLGNVHDSLLQNAAKIQKKFFLSVSKGMDKYLKGFELVDSTITDYDQAALKIILDSMGGDMVTAGERIKMLQKDLSDGAFNSYSPEFRARLAGLIQGYKDVLSDFKAANPDLFESKEQKEKANTQEAIERRKEREKNKEKEHYIEDYDLEKLFEEEDEKIARIADQYKAVAEKRTALNNKMIDTVIKRQMKLKNKSLDTLDILISRRDMLKEFKRMITAKNLEDMHLALDRKLLFVDPSLLSESEKLTMSVFFNLKKKLNERIDIAQRVNKKPRLSMTDNETKLLANIVDCYLVTGSKNKSGLNDELEGNLIEQLDVEDGLFKNCSAGFKTRLKILLSLHLAAPNPEAVYMRSKKQLNIDRYYENIEKFGLDSKTLKAIKQEKKLYSNPKTVNALEAEQRKRRADRVKKLSEYAESLDKEQDENFAPLLEDVPSVDELVEQAEAKKVQEDAHDFVDNIFKTINKDKEQNAKAIEAYNKVIEKNAQEAEKKARAEERRLNRPKSKEAEDIFDSGDLSDMLSSKSKEAPDTATRRYNIDNISELIAKTINQQAKKHGVKLDNQAKENIQKEIVDKIVVNNEFFSEVQDDLEYKLEEELELNNQEENDLQKDEVNDVQNKQEENAEKKVEEKNLQEEKAEAEENKLQEEKAKAEEELLQKAKEEEELRIQKEKEEEEKQRIQKEKEEEEQRIQKEKEEEQKRIQKEKEEQQRIQEEKAKEELKQEEEKKKQEKRSKITKDTKEKIENKIAELETKLLERQTNKEKEKSMIDDVEAFYNGNYVEEEVVINETLDLKKDKGLLINDSTFVPLCMDAKSKLSFISKDIAKKEDGNYSDIVFKRNLFMLNDKFDLKNNLYWRYVSYLPDTEWRKKLYKELVATLGEQTNIRLSKLEKQYYNEILKDLDDIDSPEVIENRIKEFANKNEYKELYDDGGLKPATSLAKRLTNILWSWSQVSYIKEIESHSAIKTAKTRDVFEDKPKVKQKISGENTKEIQVYSKSCYATCAAYMLNKFIADNKDLYKNEEASEHAKSNKAKLKEKEKLNHVDGKNIFVDQNDFRLNHTKNINPLVKDKLDRNKKNYDAGYPEVIENYKAIENDEAEGSIYEIADRFLDYADNVCVNMINFAQIGDAYKFVLKNEKGNPNEGANIAKFKENVFKTIYAKVEDLFKQRPNTPIALLCGSAENPGHFVIIKGTTQDGRLIIGDLVEAAKTEESDVVRDGYWDSENFFANAHGTPSIVMTWLERFDSKKAKEIEKTCDTYGAEYDKDGQLQNTIEAEEHALFKDKTNMLHVKGVSLDVKDEYKGQSGVLFKQQIYVPKKYNTQIENKK